MINRQTWRLSDAQESGNCRGVEKQNLETLTLRDVPRNDQQQEPKEVDRLLRIT